MNEVETTKHGLLYWLAVIILLAVVVFWVLPVVLGVGLMGCAAVAG
jgi:hypothetical protein